jgi:hypothetical protein
MPVNRKRVAPSTLASVARLLPDRVAAHYGDGQRVESLRDALLPFIADERVVNAESLAELQGTAKEVFRHLDLKTSEGLDPQACSAGWPPVDPDEIRQQGAQAGPVIRHSNGVAILELNGLAPAHAATPLLAGAFALCSDARLLVLDLRRNGGGDPATVAVIIDWLAGGPPRTCSMSATRTVSGKGGPRALRSRPSLAPPCWP